MIEKPTATPCVITAKLMRYMEARRKVLLGYSNEYDRRAGFLELSGVLSAWSILADVGVYLDFEKYLNALSRDVKAGEKSD